MFCYIFLTLTVARAEVTTLRIMIQRDWSAERMNSLAFNSFCDRLIILCMFEESTSIMQVSGNILVPSTM